MRCTVGYCWRGKRYHLHSSSDQNVTDAQNNGPSHIEASQMTDDQELLTAYHEAGHVVMAVCLGGTIVRASIEPANDDGPDRYGETVTQWPRLSKAQILQAEVEVSLAGPFAEMTYQNEPARIDSVPQWSADWQRACSSAVQLAQPELSAEQILQRASVSILRVMNSDNGWAAVAAVSDLLSAHQTIEHDECLEAIQFWLPS